ncbi:MAG: non-ribosomal peptide synthetase [Kibdelosporangium sp.]
MTRPPSWTGAGAAARGHAGFETVVSAELVAALRVHAFAGFRDLLLVTHLKVLGALTAEHEVTTGFRAGEGSSVLVRRIDLREKSWRQLAGTMTEDVPASEFGTLLDLSGLDGELPGTPGESLALRVAYSDAGGELRLRVQFHGDVGDSGYAERVAGYHLTSLRLLADDPGARHDARSLVSKSETDVQVHGLRGPGVPLPDKVFVDLFEDNVRLRPDAVAATHGDRRWTYAELNRNANRIAHALLAAGQTPEDVVAVVMHRSLEWLATLIAVLKAGGVYLPARPDFPPHRTTAQLDRGRCRFVVTDQDQGPFGDAVVLSAARCLRDAGMRHDPNVPTHPGQLAAVYFTSGSTGEPKGATWEHAGMLNHLFMKVQDMRLGPGDVVAQTASQSFGPSLWQALAPLLVCGSTRIVDTSTQLDVDRFAELLANGGVHAVQVVPAYLDVLVSYLEHQRVPLRDVRAVSVTGEPLKPELVRRWLTLCPEIPLVNAYGATEVSDDTMHAILDEPPEGDVATVGRPLRNVTAYILDEHLRVAPLGTPGEIAFSGVCVGRGYLNDPERTSEVFVEDPYRPGVRMYRTGDFGRWLPDGTIEFLGRRDEQVKLRGLRIEIGEIESVLTRVPGVRQAAVVLVGESGETRSLVAFFTGTPRADLPATLASWLPDYMIPSAFHRLAELPLTDNGKVNKRLLTGMGRELPAGPEQAPPATDTERRVVAACAAVLNLPIDRIGRDDHFYELGGTSLAAVRFVVELNRSVSLRDLVAHPVLSDLAAVIDQAARQ